MILGWLLLGYANAGPCDRMTFCREFRWLQRHGWSLKQSEAKVEHGIFTVPFLANQTEAHLVLKVCQLQIGAWRIRVEPTRQEDLEIRFDPAKDARIIDQEVVNSVVDISRSDSQNLIHLFGLNGEYVVIDCEHFKIEVRDRSKLLMEFNRNETFVFEHNRSAYTPPDRGGIMPYGLTAVGIDVTWPEPKVEFSGMLGHDGSMNIGPSPRHPLRSYTDTPGYATCGAVQIMYAHSPTLECALLWLNPSDTFWTCVIRMIRGGL
jgi:hypothetical protein